METPSGAASHATVNHRASQTTTSSLPAFPLLAAITQLALNIPIVVQSHDGYNHEDFRRSKESAPGIRTQGHPAGHASSRLAETCRACFLAVHACIWPGPNQKKGDVMHQPATRGASALRRLSTLLGAVILAQQATPALAEERSTVMLPMFSQEVILMQPENWHLSYQHQDAKKAVVEFIPADLNSSDREETLTVEAYRGLARLTTYGPEIILKTIGTELAAHCSQPLINMPLEATMVGPYKGYVSLIGCPEASEDNEDTLAGQGQMGLYVSIKGREDFYVIRHRLQGESFEASSPPLNPQNFLNYVAKSSPLMLCELGDTPQSCMQRPATAP